VGKNIYIYVERGYTEKKFHKTNIIISLLIQERITGFIYVKHR